MQIFDVIFSVSILLLHPRHQQAALLRQKPLGQLCKGNSHCQSGCCYWPQNRQSGMCIPIIDGFPELCGEQSINILLGILRSRGNSGGRRYQVMPYLPPQLVTTASQGTTVTGAYVYACSTCDTRCCCGTSCCEASVCTTVGTAASTSITGTLCTGCTSFCCCGNQCCDASYCGLNLNIGTAQPVINTGIMPTRPVPPISSVQASATLCTQCRTYCCCGNQCCPTSYCLGTLTQTPAVAPTPYYPPPVYPRTPVPYGPANYQYPNNLGGGYPFAGNVGANFPQIRYPNALAGYPYGQGPVANIPAVPYPLSNANYPFPTGGATANIPAVPYPFSNANYPFSTSGTTANIPGVPYQVANTNYPFNQFGTVGNPFPAGGYPLANQFGGVARRRKRAILDQPVPNLYSLRSHIKTREKRWYGMPMGCGGCNSGCCCQRSCCSCRTHVITQVVQTCRSCSCGCCGGSCCTCQRRIVTTHVVSYGCSGGCSCGCCTNRCCPCGGGGGGGGGGMMGFSGGYGCGGMSCMCGCCVMQCCSCGGYGYGGGYGGFGKLIK